MMAKTVGDLGKKWQLPLSPGPVGGVWPKEEKATWLNITDRSGLVRGQCEGGLGYALIGQNRGLVVANWGSGSAWDKQFSPPKVQEVGATNGGLDGASNRVFETA